MPKISERSLSSSAQVHKIGDLYLLPIESDIYTLYLQTNLLRIEYPEVIRSILKDEMPQTNSATDLMIMMGLERAYLHHCSRHGKEPAWIVIIGEKLLASFRRTLAITEIDSLAILPTLPLTGLGYVVESDKFIHRAADAFGLFRLDNVRQLGYLHQPIARRMDDGSILGERTSHTRYEHSLNVMAVMTAILSNNGADRKMMDHGRIAALTHDILTPAGGDTIKYIDPPAFDEDAHYPAILESPPVRSFMDEFELDGDLLSKTILNQGVLGQVLDLADKIAYVSRDCDTFMNISRNPVGRNFIENALSRADQAICSLWDCVEIVGEQVIVSDSRRLADFLRLRILLFKYMYFHPQSRVMEFALINVLVRYFYHTGQIAKEMLLSMTDDQLDQKLSFLAEGAWNNYRSFFSDLAVYDDFDDIGKAKRQQTELIERGEIFCVIENLTGKIKSATHFLVRDGLNIKPFYEACPEIHQELSSLCRVEKPIRLYLAKGVKINPQLASKIKDFRLSDGNLFTI